MSPIASFMPGGGMGFFWSARPRLSRLQPKKKGLLRCPLIEWASKVGKSGHGRPPANPLKSPLTLGYPPVTPQ